ncbi:MAG: hypothetical protein QME74_06250 [Candidatus Edwardsbacteria bacterium]|nr:hypothetical protein [Candidatus Edwardsbacteria bacterium]
MNTPTLRQSLPRMAVRGSVQAPALAAALAPAGLPAETCFPPLTLVPATRARGDVSCAPRFFTVQVAPLVHRSLPLPSGLDGAEAEQYVGAFARAQGQDCCVEYAGSRTVYFLSSGTRFEAAC